MRRKELETSREEALDIADRCEWGTVAMTTPEGEPYCVAVSIVREGMALYFHCAGEGEKTRCLSRCGKVCVSCVCGVAPVPEKFSTEFESAIIRGLAEPVADEQEKIRALRLICKKYAPSNPDGVEKELNACLDRTAVWKITIGDISGKRKTYK